MFPVLIAEPAAQEIREAAAYLKLQDPNRELRFLETIEKVRVNLSKLPYMYPEQRGYRRALLNPFRYALFYEVLDDRLVQVVAVFPQRRDPAALKARLGLSNS